MRNQLPRPSDRERERERGWLNADLIENTNENTLLCSLHFSVGFSSTN